VLEVGEQKHLISLVPSEETDGYYSVWAKLAPDFTRQQWLKDAPLEWAQQHAERQARILMADTKNTILVDRNAAWRCKPVDLLSNQARWLRRFGIPITEDMTRGEASDLLERAFADRERKKAEKQTRKQTKGARASA
jgi:ATP-dependent helicase IRC3